MDGNADRSAAPQGLLAIAPQIERATTEFVVRNGLPGAWIGAVQGDALAWTWAVGFADVASGRRGDARTLYRIASITKTFTATAVLQLRDEGLLTLDDPLVEHVPEFRKAANPFGPIEGVTLRRLLRHTSGLQGENPGSDPWVWQLLTPPEVLRVLDQVAVVIPPDTAFKYSNLGFHLLGEVVRRVSGINYGDYVRDRILAPLGMDSTTLDPSGDLAIRCATGYDRRDLDDEPRPARLVAPDETEGAGGLWSCVEDLARWIVQQFRTGDDIDRGPGQVLAGSTLAEMHAPAFVAREDLSEARGLGWGAVSRGGTVVVGHGGLLNGFSTRIEFSVADRLGVIVLCNGVGSPKGATDLAGELFAIALPALRSAARPALGTAPTPPALRELVGRYRDLDPGPVVRIEAHGGRLVYVDDEEGVRLVLTPTADPLRFLFRRGRPAGEPLLFLRGPDGRIAGFNAAGYPFERLDPVPRA